MNKPIAPADILTITGEMDTILNDLETPNAVRATNLMLLFSRTIDAVMRTSNYDVVDELAGPGTKPVRLKGPGIFKQSIRPIQMELPGLDVNVAKSKFFESLNGYPGSLTENAVKVSKSAPVAMPEGELCDTYLIPAHGTDSSSFLSLNEVIDLLFKATGQPGLVIAPKRLAQALKDRFTYAILKVAGKTKRGYYVERKATVNR